MEAPLTVSEVAINVGFGTEGKLMRRYISNI